MKIKLNKHIAENRWNAMLKNVPVEAAASTLEKVKDILPRNSKIRLRYKGGNRISPYGNAYKATAEVFDVYVTGEDRSGTDIRKTNITLPRVENVIVSA